jgi:hypothetical protein
MLGGAIEFAVDLAVTHRRLLHFPFALHGAPRFQRRFPYMPS